MPSSLPHYNQHTVQRQGPSQISAIHSLNVNQQNNERQSICWCFLWWKCLPANLELSLHVTEETHMLLLGCLSSPMSCRYDTRPTDKVLFICLPGSRLSENSFVWLKNKNQNNLQIWTTTHADAKSFFPSLCMTSLHGLYFYYSLLLHPWEQKLWIKTSTNSHVLFIYMLAVIFTERLQKTLTAFSAHGNVPVNLSVCMRPHLHEPDLPCTCSCQQEKRCVSCLPNGSFIHSEQHVYELYHSQSAHLSACAANKIASSTL